ncbi:putative ribosome small subunit-dependent GTPase A [Gleimia coleocanis DSM 15436]|uniref:Small ribosomal subunit biogenesis GTPase RsgA n=1 Tax=Gleimia coleocanis DSM 15436 TaxID=525245 RepID=C0VZX3_9ACTO|nr:ribosome small subunit-dependent GTPase A [Gleimia coleocanis]EEH63832.1 putative ribosome small subunit-dependent GTPase A [Gleimia coleocanis DSM 15436]
MSKRDIGTDDPRVRVRPGKGTRPRTKIRPDYSDCPEGFIFSVDRGRYHVRFEDRLLMAVKSRELGRGSIVVGDVVKLNGDLSGRKDTLARIVSVNERSSVLRRSGEDADTKGREKTMVANADNVVIVTAMTNPPVRPGFIDRCLVAAYDAHMRPIVCLTKADLGDPDNVISLCESLGVTTVISSNQEGHEHQFGYEKLIELISGQTSVLIGHSGVGKSTLINAILPEAERLTGDVNQVTGRGRHTSTNMIALELPEGGWIIDTPGIRGFGLAHVEPDTVIDAFPELEDAIEDCPRSCNHLESAVDCGLDAWVKAGADEADAVYRANRLASIRRLLESLKTAQEKPWETVRD